MTPKGERIASGDRANWMFGPKSIHLVSDTDTEYVLQVEAIGGAPQGRYTVQLAAARSATERERQLVAPPTIRKAKRSRSPNWAC